MACSREVYFLYWLGDAGQVKIHASGELRMWELFDPADGRVLLRVRWEWLARLITCRAINRWRLRSGWFMDYERAGRGWQSIIGCSRDELVAQLGEVDA